MPNVPIKEQNDFSHAIERLKWVMSCLRDPDKGCPWDLEQSNETILKHTIEEAYEVADAIEHGSNDDLKDELGDLLFQVIFYAQMAAEKGQFNFDDIAQGVTDKMISRHPHVFGDETARNADDVHAIWDVQKDKEKGKKQESGALNGVTRALPALLRAQKLQKKAAKTGFEWRNSNDAFLKVQEEINEFKDANNTIDKEEEFGDLLFSLVNFARMEGLDAEEALRKANNKFFTRFKGMEHDNPNFKNLSLDKMIEAWKKQK